MRTSRNVITKLKKVKLLAKLIGSVVNPKVLKRCKLALTPLMIKSDKFSDKPRYVVSLPLQMIGNKD